MNKNRRNGLKLEHRMIQGLRPILEIITQWSEITSCFPGRIRHIHHSSQRAFLTVQSRTSVGLKLAAHGKGQIQEVFLVTSDPDSVEIFIKNKKWEENK